MPIVPYYRGRPMSGLPPWRAGSRKGRSGSATSSREILLSCTGHCGGPSSLAAAARASARVDESRLAQISAAIEGRPAPAPSDPVAARMRDFTIAMNWDVAAGRQFPPPLGPSRTELLAMLS